MDQSTIKAFLKKANADWKENAERAKSETRSEVLDGVYITRLMSIELTETNAGDMTVLSKFLILDGDEKGTIVSQYQFFKNEDSFFYFAKGMASFGIDPEEMTWDPAEQAEENHVLNIFKELTKIKPALKLRVKTGKEGYQNKYIDRVLEDYEGDDEPEIPEEFKTGKKKAATAAAEPVKTAAKAKAAPEPDEDEEEAAPKAKGRPPGSPNKAKAAAAPVEEAEEEEGEEEEAEEVEEVTELSVGMKVKFNWKGEVLEGVVRELDEESGVIKINADGRICKASIEKIVEVDGKKVT